MLLSYRDQRFKYALCSQEIKIRKQVLKAKILLQLMYLGHGVHFLVEGMFATFKLILRNAI